MCAVSGFFLSVCALGSSLFSLLGHALAALTSELVSSVAVHLRLGAR